MTGKFTQVRLLFRKLLQIRLPRPLVAGLLVGSAACCISMLLFVVKASHHTVAPSPSVLSSKSTPSISPTATPTALSKTAPAPTPAPPPPVPVGRFGLAMGDTLTGLSAAELAKRLDDIKSLGVTWIRLDLDWNGVQERAGSYNWARFDAVAAAAGARGLKLVPILTATAPWARPGCNDAYCPPADPGQFAAFARQAVARYAPRGVHTWEIWNEPNAGVRWRPAANPGAYAALLKATYPQIKQVDPSATVITGGLASLDDGGGNISQLNYLSSLYTSGGGRYFDAVGYHPYSFPALASNPASWNAWSKMNLTNPSLRSIMAAHGDSAKKIWATEYGAPSGGPGAVATTTNFNYESSPDHVDEALEAAMATDAVRTTKSSPWLAALFWYSYQDIGSGQSTEDFYGLVRANGTKKPAYASFKQAVLNSR